MPSIGSTMNVGVAGTRDGADAGGVDCDVVIDDDDSVLAEVEGT